MPPSFTQITVCPCDRWRVGVSGWIIQMIVDVIKAPWAWLEALEPWRSAQPMETLERPGPASEVAWVASEAVSSTRWPARRPWRWRCTKSPRVLLRPQRCGGVGPRRERGGPSVIRSGRDDRPWGARRGYCSPAMSSVVPGGSIPSFYMIGSPGPQASHLEVRPVGPCRLEGKMVRAARERGPHGYG
jgi:hypothetical protein